MRKSQLAWALVAALSLGSTGAFAQTFPAPILMSPEQFAQRLKSHYDKYEKVIKVSGAKID